MYTLRQGWRYVINRHIAYHNLLHSKVDLYPNDKLDSAHLKLNYDIDFTDRKVIEKYAEIYKEIRKPQVFQENDNDDAETDDCASNDKGKRNECSFSYSLAQQNSRRSEGSAAVCDAEENDENPTIRSNSSIDKSHEVAPPIPPNHEEDTFILFDSLFANHSAFHNRGNGMLTRDERKQLLRSILESRTDIADKQVYLAGDNRHNSADSRFFGPVSVSSLLARCVVAPLSKRHLRVHINACINQKRTIKQHYVEEKKISGINIADDPSFVVNSEIVGSSTIKESAKATTDDDVIKNVCVLNFRWPKMFPDQQYGLPKQNGKGVIVMVDDVN